MKRHSREAYVLTNKLSTHFFEREEDILPVFEQQLIACGVEYFDFYLMHAQSKEIYAKFRKCNAYDVARRLKKEGRIKHFGISFHDKAAVLEQILEENPDIEVVQIQFNYVDYEDPAVQSKACYEICRKYHKPVIVMEPVKGGNLVNLPEEADAVLAALINAAGVSPSQAPIQAILSVDLYGTAVLLEEVGKVIKAGGVGVTISSQSGHRMEQLGAEIDQQLATTPTEDLLKLLVLQPENINPCLFL